MRKIFSKPYLKKTLTIMFICLAFLGLAIGLPLGLMPEKEEPHALNGSGTQASPYLIGDENDFYEFVNLVNSGGASGIYFKLDDDIELYSTFYQVGYSQGCPFDGHFISDGHNLTVYGGIENPEYGSITFGVFGYVDNGATVDLNVCYSSDFYYEITALDFYSEFGGIACNVSDGAYISGFVDLGGVCLNIEGGGNTIYFGGAVGYSSRAGRFCNDYSVYVAGYLELTINSASYSYIGGCVGGLVGSDQNSALNSVCELNLIIDGPSEVGGLVGRLSAPLADSDCGGLLNVRGGSIVGGIAGASTGTEIIGCFYSGEINVVGASMCVGGIAGRMEGVVSQCANLGTIYVYNTDPEYVEDDFDYVQYFSSVAGLVGSCGYRTSTSSLVIQESYNASIISGDYIGNIGGLVGLYYGSLSLEPQVSIAHCYNIGDCEINPDGFYSAGLYCDFNPYSYGPIEHVHIDDSFGYSYGSSFNYEISYEDYWASSTVYTSGDFLNVNFFVNPTIWDNVWDMTEIWGVPTNSEINYGYPVLREQGLTNSYKAPSYFFDGQGTSAKPYLIKNVEDLQGLANNVKGALSYSGKYFKQTANISLVGVSWTPIGTSIIAFDGSYDGANYKISGLKYNTSTTNTFGLFAMTSSATLTNIRLEEVNITAGVQIGGLVGKALNSNILNCSVTGVITGNSNVGGLVGHATSCTVTNSYNSADIVTTGNNVGGLIGYVDSSCSLKDCYNTGSVKSSAGIIGGLVGYIGGASNASMIRCYNKGYIEGINSIGGLVGICENYLTITSCYNTANVKGASSKAGGLVGAYLASNLQITNSYHKGMISGTTYVGGVVGTSGGSAFITDCAVYGGIFAYSTTCIGVFMGYNSSTATKLTNCSFVGTAETVLGAYGNSNITATATACYYDTGKVKKYTAGDFSGYTITTNLNEGYPMQNALYSVAIGGYSSADVIANLQSKGFTQI